MNSSKSHTLYIVVPAYNEEECIDDSANQLIAKLNELKSRNRASSDSKIIIVNDGSSDRTAEKIHAIHEKHKEVTCINFSCNFGHQAAVLAGYNFSAGKCDCAISIDADLQQDINAIDDFLDEYEKGNDVVYGVRNSRDTDGFMKKASSQMFYSLMSLFGTRTIRNHADYRLLSNKALLALAEYKEGGIFLRGLIPTLGLKSSIVHFDVKDRQAGVSKYTLSKMLRLASDGITSFSITPIHFIFSLGGIILLLSMIVMIYTLVCWAFGRNINGYTTIVLLICFFGALQLIAIGVIGEYVGKNYIEAKKRPRYIIDSVEHE